MRANFEMEGAHQAPATQGSEGNASRLGAVRVQLPRFLCACRAYA